MYQLVNGEVGVSRLRDIEVEDLLGRDPIAVDLNQIAGYVSGKTVLVTGGGGSIGSELCRQIANHKPKKLIIYIMAKNSFYIKADFKRSCNIKSVCYKSCHHAGNANNQINN